MSWPLVSFIEVCNIQGGTQPPKIEFIEEEQEGYVRLLQIQDFKRADKAVYVPDKKTLKKCAESDLLIGRYGASVGKILTGLSGAYNVAIVKTIPDLKRLDRGYLYHYLCSPLFQNYILSVGSRAAQAGFNKDDLASLEVPLPPLLDQRRIAAILDKADAIRRKRQQAIQLADDFLRAVFLDMFGDPVTNPKGWEVKLLKDLSLKIHSGNTPKGGKENYVGSGVVFLRSQNVWKRKIIFDDVAYIDSATHKKMAGSSLKYQDILMTKTGRFNTENSSLGRAAMFCGEDDSANVNGHVYLIRLGGEVDKKFVLFILTMPEYYEYIRSVCVGGIDKRQLNKEHLENFPIIFPSADLQRKFSEAMDVVDRFKAQAANALQNADLMFEALSQKAFSGHL